MSEQSWKQVVELDQSRNLRDGDFEDLATAIRHAADLRILTEFLHGEHIDPSSDSKELIREVCNLQITYLLDNRYTAGIM